MDSSEDEEGPLSEEREREKDIYSEDEDKGTMDDSEETEDSTKSDKPDGAGGITWQGNRVHTGAIEGRDERSEAGYEDGTSKEANMTTARM